jgi:rod shape-determining protein MreD
MRTATIVLVAYALCVVVAAVWARLPGDVRDAIPDLGVMTAAYLGLTARRNLAPAVGGTIVLGYLLDIISGTPVGLCAFVLAWTGLVARAVQQRIYVRGTAMTVAFSAFVAIVAGVIGVVTRMVYGLPHAPFAVEARHIALVAIATAVVGAPLWRLFRRIDAAYARTHRDRDAALEGIT